jgi:thiosulfate/3-mercaptopyruvate sulfurtransferase
MFLIMLLQAAVYAHPEQLVDTAWVAAHGHDANVRVVDMRQAGYADGHVPDAVSLSPVAIRDAKAAPTFLPTPAAFEAMMARLGIGDATRVIVYDERGGIYAARLWWILNYFGQMDGREPHEIQRSAVTAGRGVHRAAASRDGRNGGRRDGVDQQAGRENRRREDR